MTASAEPDRGEEVRRVMEDARFLHEQAASRPAAPIGPQPCSRCGQWHTGRTCGTDRYVVEILDIQAVDRLAAAAERIAAAMEHNSLLARVAALEGEVKRLRIQG